MKIAKEWVSEIGTYSTGNDNWNKVSPKQIESIQLTAAKRALDLAADEIDKAGTRFDMACSYKERIITLRDNLTIEQLNA